jgi:crotonobetainyl-CoA:carnitine CoA-transferase CaiB-like acyl-CoA transferase
MNLPLDGIRVLEFAAGPPVEWACRLLSDFGAEVIKVERIPKPKARFAPSRPSGMVEDDDPDKERLHKAYDALNRNKKSIALDMKSSKGREVFRRLVMVTDILVEGFRPGVMERLHADYRRLKEINEALIYCSVTGYGQTSSFDTLVGHDLNYISISGILDLTGEKGGPPVIPGTQVADWGGASQAVIGILLALAGRRKSGHGQHIDISLTDSAVSWLMFLASEYFATGYLPKRGENVTTGVAPFNNVYRAKDGKYLSIACWEPKFYENLCRVLGKEEYIPFQDADGEKREEISRAFREVIRTKTRDQWFRLLKDMEVCVAPVYDFAEALSSDYAKERQYVLSKEHPVLGKIEQLGVPIKLSETPGRWRSFSPSYGQDTDKILEELGFSPGEIEIFHDERVVG